MVYIESFIISWFLVGILIVFLLFYKAYKFNNFNKKHFILHPAIAVFGWLSYFVILFIFFKKQRKDKLMMEKAAKEAELFKNRINASEMYARNTLVAHEKLMENLHKPDLLSLPIWQLKGELNIEHAEFALAIDVYNIDPSIENKNRLDREAGDILNYTAAIISKTDGKTSLIRDSGIEEFPVPEYTEAINGEGVVILKDGVQQRISDLLKDLNNR